MRPMPKSRPQTGRRIADPENLASLLQDELGNVEIVQVVRGTCLVSSDTDAVPASVVGRSDTESVMADRLISRRLGIGSGDRLEVISARQRLTPMGPLPVRIRTEIERVTSPEPGSESGEVILPIRRGPAAAVGRTGGRGPRASRSRRPVVPRSARPRDPRRPRVIASGGGS